MQAAQQLPPPQRRPLRDPNVPTAGRLTQAIVHTQNASSTAGTRNMPPGLRTTASTRGVIWRRSTLLKSRASSYRPSTHQVTSGLGLWTMTMTECGSGLMGQASTSPTGYLVLSLMEGCTTATLLWTLLIT